MAKDLERFHRDRAGVGPDPAYSRDLVSMDDLHNFKVAEGEPDIRGWDVCTLAGTEIGEVDDLLIDPERGEVVMLGVDIKDSDRHAEVPVRVVQLDRGRKRVIVDSGEVDGYIPANRRERLGAAERERLRDAYRDTKRREVRYSWRDRLMGHREARDTDDRVLEDDTVEETVVERKPVVMEEVVVRRRVVDGDLDAGSR